MIQRNDHKFQELEITAKLYKTEMSPEFRYFATMSRAALHRTNDWFTRNFIEATPNEFFFVWTGLQFAARSLNERRIYRGQHASM